MNAILDCHTHSDRPGAVIDIDPVSVRDSRVSFLDDRVYSVGIHPWNAECCTQADLSMLDRLACDTHVVAIGETGLDSVHSTCSRVQQTELLMHHISLSEDLRKPLLLHIVKCYPEIMRLRLKLKPRMPWIIHGFRGKPALATDLVDKGFYLSYGEKFNPLSVIATPPGRMLAETDESKLDIARIIAALPVPPAVTLPDLLARCAADR